MHNYCIKCNYQHPMLEVIQNLNSINIISSATLYYDILLMYFLDETVFKTIMQFIYIPDVRQGNVRNKNAMHKCKKNMLSRDSKPGRYLVSHISAKQIVSNLLEPRMKHHFFCTNFFISPIDLIFIYSMRTTKSYFQQSSIA